MFLYIIMAGPVFVVLIKQRDLLEDRKKSVPHVHQGTTIVIKVCIFFSNSPLKSVLCYCLHGSHFE